MPQLPLGLRGQAMLGGNQPLTDRAKTAELVIAHRGDVSDGAARGYRESMVASRCAGDELAST
ncbi:MAG: hypothetical protein ABWY77_01185, partial [Acidimicrobiia bacterium]